MPNSARNWCFTLNNWTDDEKNLLCQLVETSQARYLVFQQEVGEEGTPHLQGYISFERRKTLNSVKALVGNRAHLEVARGSPQSNRNYCTKQDTRVEGTEPEEFGEVPTPQGGDSRLDELKAAIRNGARKRECLEDFSDVCAKYPRFVDDYISIQVPTIRIPVHPLHQWQRDLQAALDLDPDDRSITFVVDEDGNKGKTYFCKYYASLHPQEVQILTPARKLDMAYALRDDIRVLFVNISRTYEEEHVKYLYAFLEEVKDGLVFSPKFRSGMKFVAPCHVVVMLNHQPAMTMSEDRYLIINI